MTAHERQRPAALHEHRLLDAPADDELEAVVRVAAMVAGGPTATLARVRFYASPPLVTPQGYALGTLCVFDAEPRELTDERIARLEDLAGVILTLGHLTLVNRAARRWHGLDADPGVHSDGAPLGAVVAMNDVTAYRAQRRELERAHSERRIWADANAGGGTTVSCTLPGA